MFKNAIQRLVVAVLIMGMLVPPAGSARELTGEVGALPSSSSLYRTQVAVRQPADWTRLERVGVTVLEQGDDWALVLVDEAQLETLARLRFEPRGTDELGMLVTAHAQAKPWLAASVRPLLQAWEEHGLSELTDQPLGRGSESANSAHPALTPELKAGLATLTSVDDDADGLTNTEEQWWCTDPMNPNSDGDAQGYTDGQEVDALLDFTLPRNVRWGYGPPFGPPAAWPDFNGADGNPATPACNDGDYDTIPDYAEAYVVGFRVPEESTDHDKFDDGQELFGVTYCPGAPTSCGYGSYPRIEYWSYIQASMPNWVLPPGDNPFVAAFPVPEVYVTPGSWHVERKTIITTELGEMTQTQNTYETSVTRGESTSIADTVTWNNWEEVSQAVETPFQARSVAVESLAECTPVGSLKCRAFGAAKLALGGVGGVVTGAGALIGKGLCIIPDPSDLTLIITPAACAVGAGLGAASGGLFKVAGSGWRDLTGGNTPNQLQSNQETNKYDITNVNNNINNINSNVNNVSSSAEANVSVVLNNNFDFQGVVNSLDGVQYAINRQGELLARGLYDISYAISQPRFTETRTNGRSWGGAQTTTHEVYEEHSISEGEAFTTGEQWSTAWAVDSSHAADLTFEFTIKNSGTEYARELTGMIVNVYISDGTSPAISYPAWEKFPNGKLENLFPGNSHTFTSNPIPLTLNQMRRIDLGERLTVVVEDYSFGADELFYQNAVDGGVTVFIEDGVEDGDEAVDSYMIPTWGTESVLDVLTRYFPAGYDAEDNLNALWTPEFDGANPPTWHEHFLSDIAWWNVYLTQQDAGNTPLKDLPAQAGSAILFRFNRDSDRDGYPNRAEFRYYCALPENHPDRRPPDHPDRDYCTDGHLRPEVHPQPQVLAGYVTERNGDVVTVKLVMENTGTFDAYGIDAVMYAPNDTVTIGNNTVGGNGRVRPGRHVAVGSLVKPPDLTNWGSSTAKPYAGGDYAGAADRTYIFSVSTPGVVGQGSTAMAWSDGAGGSSTLNLGGSYHAPLPLDVAQGLQVGFNTGTLAAGASFTVQALTPRDTFTYTINSEPYMPPVIVVSYSDPQGSHRFITPVELPSLDSDLAPYSGQMLKGLALEIQTTGPVTTTSPNTTNFVFNSPHPAAIQGAHLYLDFVSNGTLVAHMPYTLTLQPGPTVYPVSWSTSAFSQTYDPDADNILIAFWTDAQGNIIDSAARPLSSFQADPKPAFAMDETTLTWDFNSAPQDVLLKWPLIFANTGFLDLLTYASMPPGIRLSAPSSRRVVPGDMITYGFLLDTADLPVGPYDQTITIRTSDPENPDRVAHVTGIITEAPADAQAESTRLPVSERVRIAQALQGAPVMFVENVGQFPNGVRFQVRGANATLWLAEDSLWFTILEPAASSDHLPLLGQVREQENEGQTHRGVALKLTFVGANPHPTLEPFHPLPTKMNYLVGNDSAKWRSGVPVWGGVRYRDLYPGVDLEISGEGGRFTWRFAIRNSQFATSNVRLRVEGADSLSLEGDYLHISTPFGGFTLPLLSVEGGDIQSTALRSALEGNAIIHPFTPYPGAEGEREREPRREGLSRADNPSDLLFSTFVGGSAWDYGSSLALDGAGNVMVTGRTSSSGFPTTPGAYDTSYNESGDVFVFKLSADGSALLFSTFVGGSSGDFGYSLALDGAGNVVVTGETRSSDFPITDFAYDPSFNGSLDVFVFKLSAEGGSLLFSTYIGGSSQDTGQSLALNRDGNIVVTGYTESSDFPTTTGAYDTSHNGSSDVFVLKLAYYGWELLYSTFVGGSSNDLGYSLALDENGNPVVTGWTESSDFPTALCPGHDKSYNGDGDAFVFKLYEGRSLLFSTFVGGSSGDSGLSLVLDEFGNVRVMGSTTSSDFPTTIEAYDTSHNGGTDVFVLKLSANGILLLFSTFVGGSSPDTGWSLTLDGDGNIVVTGFTNSFDFPATAGAYDTSLDGSSDVFVFKLSAEGGSYLYGTFVGGSSYDLGYSLALDGDGNVVVTGETVSSDFPISANAFDTTFNGGFYDAFVTKLAMAPPGSKVRYIRLLAQEYSSVTMNLTVGESGSGYLSIAADVGDDSTMDWNWSGMLSYPAQLTTSNLASAFNAYLSGHSCEVDVPIRFSLAPFLPLSLSDFTATPLAQPDATLGTADIAFGSSNPIEGDTVPITATLTNNGSANSGPLTAAFFATPPGGFGETYIGAAFVPNVPAGGTADATIQWNTLGFTGDVPVRVVADPYNRVAETNDDNNEATASLTILTRPDLHVTAIEPSDPEPVADQPVTVQVTQRNDGQTNAGASIIALYDGNPESGGALICEVTSPVPGEGETAPECPWAPIASGPHRLFAISDRDDAVNEFDEGNNQSWEDVHVGFAGPILLDSGTAGDVDYTAERGYGYVDEEQADILGNCGTEPYQTYRLDADGRVAYHFDHLLPGHFYHLDVTLYECGQGAGRQEVVKVDDMTVGGPEDLGDGEEHRLSILLDPALYADRTISVTVEAYEGLGALVNEIALHDVDYRYADSGPVNDPQYPTGDLPYGWLDGSSTSASGSLPYQTARVDLLDNDVQYQFDELDPLKRYQVHLSFYQSSGNNRVQQVWIDGQPTGTELTIVSGQHYSATVSAPLTAYQGDGSIVVSVVRTDASVGAMINEIALEEETQIDAATCPDIATPYWTIAYNNVTIAGQPAPPGTVVTAESPRGDVVGCFIVKQDTPGLYGFMPIYGEDPTANPPIPGMRDGDTVIFRINGALAAPSPSLEWHDDKTPHQVDLEVIVTPPQTILLTPGWNLISFYVEPPVPLVDTVLQHSIQGKYCLVLGEKDIYDCEVPEHYRSLKELHGGRGYYLRLEGGASANLLVEGVPITPTTPIPLHPGWNWVGYLPRATQPVTVALQSIAGHYLWVTDGSLFYDPTLPEFSTLTEMEPDDGYLIYATDAVTLTYPSGGGTGARLTSAAPTGVCPEVASTPYFTLLYGSVNLNGGPAPVGTRMEVITPRGEVAGCFIVDEAGQYGFLPVYGEDEGDPPIPGFREGEPLTLRINGWPVESAAMPTWTDDKQPNRVDLAVTIPYRLYLPLLW